MKIRNITSQILTETQKKYIEDLDDKVDTIVRRMYKNSHNTGGDKSKIMTKIQQGEGIKKLARKLKSQGRIYTNRPQKPRSVTKSVGYIS